MIGFVASLLLAVAASAPTPQSSDDASRFTFYDMPTALAGPCDLTTGPDGAIWVQDILVDKIARVDPETGEVEEYTIPYTTGPLLGLGDIAGRGALACAIQPGDDGNLYAASGIRNQFLRINPTTKNITVFTPPPGNPLGNLQPFNDLYAGPTGMYASMSTGDTLFHFDYETEEFTYFPTPTKLSGPVGVYYASDGGVWFCEFLANKIGRLDPQTSSIVEYDSPLLTPTVMRAETEGKYLWFTAFVGNGIGRVEMATGEITAFPNPSLLSFPTEDTVDCEGNIWFSTATQNTLNYLTPSTGKVTVIEQPGTLITAPISIPPQVDIAIHYGPGNAIWFTEVATNRVGRYQLTKGQ